MVYDWLVGASICTKKARSNHRVTAIQASGTHGTAISNRLDGMWVKTIVFSSPIRRARRAATHREIAVKTLDAKNKAPREPGWSPKRVKNQ